jgi:tartrate dehydratase alpha subunit/fumarate hydratase class I-like protein
VVVLICCIAVGVGIVQELAAKRKKAAALSQIDREVSDLVASYQDSHTFHVPELGITMADGGEDVGKKDEK